MGIKGKLKLLSNDRIKTPMLVGLFKTYLILPEVEMSDKELRVIFRHELIHFKRHDLWVKSLALVANAIHWFNPFAYRLTKNIDTFCELSCDERVVSDMDMEERRFYGETILNVLCRVVNQHSGVYATLAESKKGIERRLTHMMNVKKNPKRIILISLVAAVILCLIGFVSASLINITVENKTYKEAERMIENYMTDFMGDDPQKGYYGEYSVGGIKQMGNYTFAVADYHPNEGQGGLYLFVFEKKAGKLVIIDRLQGELPISMGVTVYKFTVSNKTVVFGVVNDQLWLNLDGAPQKVDFTQVKALYSNGKEQSVKVSNFQTFMICIDGDVYIDDVLFLSGNEVAGKLSALPISENVIDNFNTLGDPSTLGSLSHNN